MGNQLLFMPRFDAMLVKKEMDQLTIIRLVALKTLVFEGISFSLVKEGITPIINSCRSEKLIKPTEYKQ